MIRPLLKAYEIQEQTDPESEHLKLLHRSIAKAFATMIEIEVKHNDQVSSEVHKFVNGT